MRMGGVRVNIRVSAVFPRPFTFSFVLSYRWETTTKKAEEGEERGERLDVQRGQRATLPVTPHCVCMCVM